MSTMTKMDLSIAERKAYEFLLRTEEAKRWIEEMIQEKLPPGTANFGEMLRDGVALAKLGKIFAPTAIKKINKPASGSVLEFMAVDNISQFFNACKLANFPDHYVFEVTDLWELKNVYKVIHCLHTLSLHLYRNGLSIKMQNLQNANLKFSKEEIEKTQKMLEQMEETAMDFPVDVTEVAEEESNEISDESIDTIEELADPSMCEAEGEGLHKATAGKEAAFTIISKDSDGNILKDSNETFKVTLFYDDETDKRITIHANVQNNHDGTYAVTYTPEISGHYKMELVLFDTEMNEEVDQLTKVSPCNVTVLPSPESDPSKCTLSGQGIDSAVAGVLTEFVLTSFDKFGNRGAGGEAFNATLTNEQNDIVNCTVEELGDGRYKFSYTCPKSSVYELKVNLGDVSVGTKQVTVKDAGVSDPSKCGLVGIDSVLDKKAGELSQFVIQARDTHGNDRSSGGEKFTVQVLRGEELVTEAQVTDSNDGKYGVEYSLTQSGEYSLHIKLGDQQLCEPKKITIHDTGLTDPSKCVFKGEDYLSFNAGAQMTASLEARDVYGNKREKGGDVFILQFTSKETMETAPSNAVKFTDNQNGEYGFEYVLEKAGEYAMEVLLKEAVDTHATHSGENTSQLALINLKAFLSKYKYTNVPGFPAAIIVKDAGVTDPRYVQFAGDGVSNALQGKDSEFVIKCRDRFMNNRTTGGENVEVLVVNEARKIEFAATVTDNNDGTYRVNYTPKASGKTKLIVKINGVQVDSEVLQGGVLVSPPNIGDASNFVDSILDHDLLSSLLNAFRVENDTDNLVDLIQKVREELIKQIRENTKIEGNVRDKERRIALLAENRYRAEEILNQPTGILAYFQKKKPAVEEVKTSDKFNIKDFVDYYSSLFYLLQTNPKYLAKCLFLVPAREMDTFLQTVTLTLYGYAFSPREEYLILSLFNETLQLEVQNSSIDNFLNNNPVLIKLVVNYCHERIQGKQFLQKILYDKILEPIIEEKDLNLNLNAVTILKERISQQEVETGVKSDINIKDMTYEKAMQDEYVSKLVQQRTKKMIDICQSILDTLIDNINELPYGLRYICRQLKTMLQKKNPEAPEEDVNRVVSYLLFFRFLNGPLCGPDAYNLTKKKISASMRNNLAWISKVLMRVSTFKEFDKNVDIHFCVMNNWIQQSTPAFVDKFMKPSISIPEPEEHLGVHQFIELTQKKAPTITITLNELAQTHSLLVKFMTKIAPDNKDPLREVLEKIKDKVPEQVDANKNEEISLPLQVRTNIENLDLEMKPEQLYEVTKENFRTILRNIGPQQLGENVEETIDKADSYADEIIDDSKKEADGILLKRKIEEIRKALPRLVEVEILSKDNHYRRILVDITKEIQNRGEVRKRQQRELERLKESLAQLREHNNFLKDKDKTLDDFVQQTLRNYFENKKRKGNQKAGNKKVYKFSYDQLTEKYKVIAEMAEGGAAKKKVKFQISMDESVPGLFTVEAKFASLTVRTIQIRLDDLLDKREKGESVLKLDGVTLNVNMTIWLMNKLFVQK